MLKQKNKSRHLATISLTIMGIGFIVTMPFQHSLWVEILQGGFEAGLVGGLADWFAVTALFRHPLGIPIPHTALLPKNRDRIIAGIIAMLENDWLTKESIRKKIDTFQMTDRIFTLVHKEIHSNTVQRFLINLIQKFIQKVEVQKITPLVANELKTKINDWDIQDSLPLLIDQITKRKYDEKTLDFVLTEIDEWARKDSTKYNLGGMAVNAVENIKADGFMQFALKSFSNLVNEEKLGSIIQNLILKGVDSYRDPFNQNRQTLLNHIHTKLESIKTDEKIYEELTNFKAQLVEKWEPEEQISEILTGLQQRMINFVEQPTFMDDYVVPLIVKAVNELKENPEKTAAIEDWIKTQLGTIVDQNHAKIGRLVQENLEKLDNKTLIHMVETNVGKDLQWIRVNGAVCGFLIGLILVGIRIIF